MTAPREMTAAEIVFHASPCEPIDDRTRVHAWLLDLDDMSPGDVLQPDLPAGLFVLSPDEETRAARLRNPLERQRWRLGRAMVRHILGTCLHVAPQAIQFAQNVHGKPFVLHPANNATVSPRFDFNLSHSENSLLVGVSFGSAIGVDIEFVNQDFDVTSLAETHFSPAERQQLAALPFQTRQLAFYRCWTLKEAALKAQGLGISAGLDVVELNIDSSGNPRVVKPAVGADAYYQRIQSMGESTAAAAIYTQSAPIRGPTTKSCA